MLRVHDVPEKTTHVINQGAKIEGKRPRLHWFLSGAYNLVPKGLHEAPSLQVPWFLWISPQRLSLYLELLETWPTFQLQLNPWVYDKYKVHDVSTPNQHIQAPCQPSSKFFMSQLHYHPYFLGRLPDSHLIVNNDTKWFRLQEFIAEMYINSIQSNEGVIKPVLTTVGPKDIKAALLQCSKTCQ